MKRIPITMCHGMNRNRQPPFDEKHLTACFRTASEMGFTSISYDDLADWRAGARDLPERPIMFDFDHPAKSIWHEIHPIMREFGYRGNLFINTGLMEGESVAKLLDPGNRLVLTWDEIRSLMQAGWHIGAHTHTHPNLSELSRLDPSGEAVRRELVTCDEILQRELNVVPRDFAFTGTTWSSVAEREVQKRYRFGRLWIIGSMYEVDGGTIRYADLACVPGKDESDGGPPEAARYVTRDTHPYRLPSMEMEALIFEHDAFCRYLAGAMNG